MFDEEIDSPDYETITDEECTRWLDLILVNTEKRFLTLYAMTRATCRRRKRRKLKSDLIGCRAVRPRDAVQISGEGRELAFKFQKHLRDI